MMINTAECEKNCKYGINYGDKKNLKVLCQIKNKSYYYGERLNCDFCVKRGKDERDN